MASNCVILNLDYLYSWPKGNWTTHWKQHMTTAVEVLLSPFRTLATKGWTNHFSPALSATDEEITQKIVSESWDTWSGGWQKNKVTGAMTVAVEEAQQPRRWQICWEQPKLWELANILCSVSLGRHKFFYSPSLGSVGFTDKGRRRGGWSWSFHWWHSNGGCCWNTELNCRIITVTIVVWIATQIKQRRKMSLVNSSFINGL